MASATYVLKQPIPAILVTDIERSQAFYATHFGFHSAWNHEGYGGMERDGMHIHFMQKAEVNPIFVYNQVTGVDDLYASLVAEGVKIVATLKDHDYGMREFTALDPDGNFIAFGQTLG